MHLTSAVALFALIIPLAVWIPVASSGLPVQTTFALRTVDKIDAGVTSFQNQTHPDGSISCCKTDGWKTYNGWSWNVNTTKNGYVVDSFNLSNIPNVAFIDWDFQVLVGKLRGGVPQCLGFQMYECQDSVNTLDPFNRFMIHGDLLSQRNYTASWLDQVVSSNTTRSEQSDWYNGLAPYYILEDNQLVQKVLENITQSQAVNVTIKTVWKEHWNISIPDANLESYPVDFQRTASLWMLVRNNTVLQAVGTFTVHVQDFPSIILAYHSLTISEELFVDSFFLLYGSFLALLAVNEEKLIPRLRQRLRQPSVSKTARNHML